MRFNTQVLLFRAHKSLAVSGVCDDVGRELDMALACIDAALPHLGPELAAVKPQLEKERAEIAGMRFGL